MYNNLVLVSGTYTSVADPEFPPGGGANPSAEGCQHKILPNFPKNCMKLKEFGPGGASLLMAQTHCTGPGPEQGQGMGWAQ